MFVNEGKFGPGSGGILMIFEEAGIVKEAGGNPKKKIGVKNGKVESVKAEGMKHPAPAKGDLEGVFKIMVGHIAGLIGRDAAGIQLLDGFYEVMNAGKILSGKSICGHFGKGGFDRLGIIGRNRTGRKVWTHGHG